MFDEIVNQLNAKLEELRLKRDLGRAMLDTVDEARLALVEKKCEEQCEEMDRVNLCIAILKKEVPLNVSDDCAVVTFPKVMAGRAKGNK